MIRERLFLIIAFFLIAAVITFAQDSAEILTLNDFIIASCKNSHFEEILIDELYLQYEEELKIPMGDFILEATAGYQFNYMEEESDSIHSVIIDTSLKKLFALSGTELSLSYGITPETFGRDTSSNLNISIGQEIIKNVFGKTNRLKKEIAGLEKQVAQYQIIEAYEDYLSVLLSLYHEWYLSYVNVVNAELSVKDSEELLSITQEKLQYSVADMIDLNKSQLQVLTKKEILLKAQQEYGIILIQIKEAAVFEDPDVDIIPQFTPPSLDIMFDENELKQDMEDFLSESRTYHILDELNKINSISKIIAYDDLLPSASLYLDYSLSGEGYFFLDNRQHEINLGIVFKLPISDNHKKADFEISELDIRKTNLSAQNKMLNLNRELKTLLESIKYLRQLIELTESKIEYANAIVLDEEKDYLRGRADLNDLISAYDVLESNRYAKNNYEIQLSLLYIEWLRLTDKLVNQEMEITDVYSE